MTPTQHCNVINMKKGEQERHGMAWQCWYSVGQVKIWRAKSAWRARIICAFFYRRGPAAPATRVYVFGQIVIGLQCSLGAASLEQINF